ncbi:MAG: hypothetical protein AAFY59_00995 [Pseudomonadota bacterium]
MLVGVFLVSACGGSNPLGSIGSLNPFGGGAAAEAEVPARATTLVPAGTILLPATAEVRPEPALRGIILRATAVAPTQGYYGAVLVPERRGAPDENGIVTFQFRVFPPISSASQGPQQTRLLTAGAFVSDDDLEVVRGFRVVTETGSVNLAR